MDDVERELETIILAQPIDLTALRAFSRRKGGFQNNKMRIRVWPKLMDVNRYKVMDFRQEIDPHRDDSQVQCDVERSLWNIEIIQTWRDSYRERRRQALSDIIVSILCRNKGLHYYQGFHDIVSVFLLVFQDDHLAFAVSERVALSYLVDFMQKDFELVCQFMKIVLVIVEAADPELHAHLMEANMEPFFATSWLITWFSHDIKRLDDVARLFDAIMSSPPLYIYYMSAAYVIYLREELLETEADFAMMHSTLARAPEKFGFPIETIIASADELMKLFDVDEIKSIVTDIKLLQLMNSKKIVSISRPCFTKTWADSDWTLLQQMRLIPNKTWPFNANVFKVLWTNGWNLTFLSSAKLRTLEQQKKKENQNHVFQSRQEQLLNNAAKAKANTKAAVEVEPSVIDYVLGAVDEVMYVMYINARMLRNRYEKSERYVNIAVYKSLLVSITVVVSGSMLYSWWNGSHKLQ